MRLDIQLSDEQQNFINMAKYGKNILVDACIGSGKTTAIQHLCCELPSNLKILYLTYNKLLKIDAKSKIKGKNTTVTNYHGFAYLTLRKMNINAGVTDLVQKFLEVKPPLPHYDVLVIDEYQDIEQELADMLIYIKDTNPLMQIVAVGDMQQKIYDKTTLNVPEFMQSFLGEYDKMSFTKCFRLSNEHAAKLGRIWNKPIVGVNNNCIVGEMDIDEVVTFLSKQDPKDILCLGARIGDMADTINQLEENYADKFNKKTLYASIADDDSNRCVTPDNNCAIFTTFDSSKGLERKICVIFDFTESYWQTRVNKPQQSFDILRNIFCVAASRGKERIIFVNSGESILSERTLMTKPQDDYLFNNMNISDMFDFKYKEDIEECYKQLIVKPIIQSDTSEIQIKNRDELIDLSPCIGIYQEAVFFGDYDIDKSLDFYFRLHPQYKKSLSSEERRASLDRKILMLTSLETRQQRYVTQVNGPLVKKKERNAIIKRLHTVFNSEENVQVSCNIRFSETQDGKIAFSAMGLADVVKDETVYELKFVSELTHEHFLQCACYVVALNLPRGILWNTRNNKMFEIRIDDRKKFLDAVAKAATKDKLTEYYSPKG